MNVSINDLKAIASRGGGMVLDAAKISAEDLKVIVLRASGTKAQIFLKNANVISPDDLKAIASRAEGCVVFDFYDV